MNYYDNDAFFALRERAQAGSGSYTEGERTRRLVIGSLDPGTVSPIGPPRVSQHVAHRQAVRLGRTVKLTCPVEGDPPALIMWTKDGRNIHSGWSRFRVLPLALRIKAVETEDAGTYVCKAANGFGSVNVNYTLIVIGDHDAGLCL
ncbi:unnamed protein product [Boreogadus saida]